MPSPFPGMDPYLEASGRWEDFHDSFLVYFRDKLLDSLSNDYDVSVQERVASISVPDDERKRAVLDIGVTTNRRDNSSGGGLAVLESGGVRVAHVDFEPARESYLEITHKPDDRLVTMIELLSPANKEKPGSDLYRAKREALLLQYVHIVEIDLLMQGARLPMKPPVPPGDSFVYITRAEDRAFAEVIAWTIRQPLPQIPIPLAEPDPDLKIDLQSLFDYAYDRGRYGRKLKYDTPLPKFIRSEDQQWAQSLMKSA